MKKKMTEFLHSISMLLYLASCIMPCLQTKTGKIYGLYCLLTGWTSFLYYDFWLFFIWCSNIIYIYVVVCLIRDKKIKILLPLTSLIFAISMPFYNIFNDDTVVYISEELIGYYLWCISYLILFVVCFLKRRYKCSNYANID